MLTPAFDLSQDPDFLTIAIRVPYARVSEFDVYFEGVDFRFHARPYFLRRVAPRGPSAVGNAVSAPAPAAGIRPAAARPPPRRWQWW